LTKKYSYIIFIYCCILSLLACNKPKNTLPDLKESYVYTDSRPFGGLVAYKLLHDSYPDKEIEIGKKAFAENYGWHYDTHSLYFNISNKYYATERDAESLLDYVYKGNTAFIAANYFDDSLMNRLFCKQNYTLDYFSIENVQQTSIEYTNKLSFNKDSFGYFYLPFDNKFDSINSSYARVLGYNRDGDINMFTFLWGKGRFYFHCEPKAFSNYFLLSNNNYKYFQQALQMLPSNPQNIYWDNFYAKKTYSGSNKSSSSLSEIFKYPPLRTAFWISLALLLLFILFSMKRRQRIVPIIKPTENTSIAFAEAIAGLYLSKKDNKIIADKIITYYNEQVRTKYYITIQVNDNSYADVLSRKSGVSLENTTKLANTILRINASEKVSDEELLSLNGQIENFFGKGS
jgi:hypothetical protein